jgi:hypothetical protein
MTTSDIDMRFHINWQPYVQHSERSERIYGNIVSVRQNVSSPKSMNGFRCDLVLQFYNKLIIRIEHKVRRQNVSTNNRLIPPVNSVSISCSTLRNNGLTRQLGAVAALWIWTQEKQTIGQVTGYWLTLKVFKNAVHTSSKYNASPFRRSVL